MNIRNILFSFFALITLSGISSDFSDSIFIAVGREEQPEHEVNRLLEITDKLKHTDPDNAIILASHALKMADSLNLEDQRLKAMIDLGTIQAFKTQFAPALELAFKAQEIAQKRNDKWSLAKTGLIIGMIKIYQGDYTGGYESFFSSLRLFEEIHDQEGIINSLNGIGNVLFHQGNRDKAFEYYIDALDRARKINDTIQIGNVINNIGLILNENGEYQKAIGYYEEAVAINVRKGLKIRIATNYINLAACYVHLNNDNAFQENYNNAVQIYSEMESWHNLAMCYLIMADYCTINNYPAERLSYIRKAYETASRYKLRDISYLASGYMHDFYLSSRNIDSAYKYSIISGIEKDSLNFAKSSARLTLLEMEYNYDKKQEEAKLEQQRKDFTKILFIIIAISGLLISILFLSRQITKTKNIRLEKKRLSDEVEHKNKELTLNVMNLIKKNELIVDLSNSLKQLQQNVSDEKTKEEILRLVNSLHRNASKEIWEEFELRFRQVHNSYYEKLLERFPDLTPNELKLCALLRLNLSTKEICELSGQRPSSLDVARYRLRKKLGLGNSQINLVTFLSQV